MAELRPIPLATLLRRAYHEHARSRAIFDLPARSFYRAPDFSGCVRRAPVPGSEDPGLHRDQGAGRHRGSRLRGNDERKSASRDQRASSPDPDLSVAYAGIRAPNPIGPAAGPHTQLAQNIVLSWLAGAGVIELKTIQVNDRLTIARPCIDMKTVGYNTEWSQELSLEESLREYVKGSMIIDTLLGIGDPGSGIRENQRPVFDISVGYDLAGITSAPVVRWLERMKDASSVVDELRAEIPNEFAALKDLPFRTAISQSVTLSTFHGAPAEEIERICEFLIGNLGFHTVIKLNPPMLGRAQIEHLLHGVLGYDDVEVNPHIYDRELPFDEGVDLVRRLQGIATRCGLTIGVKCGNTLEVRNRGAFLKAPVQYLSGQPLHALHAALALQWRQVFGPDLQISFAGGVDAQNVADCVAAGLVPVTTCTDLLRPGGYARLPKYLQSLESRMKQVGAATIDDFVVATASAGIRDSTDPRSAWLDEAARQRERRSRQVPGPFARALTVNSSRLFERACTGDRYRAGRNRRPPRKQGTHLWLWDCLSCRKCIPVCPNDAIFELETESFVGEVPVIDITPNGWQERERRLYRALKTTQIIIFADACNDCGNCDVFCPEDGGPHLEKPRFFGSLETYRQAAPLPGFVLTTQPGAHLFALHGRFPEGEYVLERDFGAATALFVAPGARVTIDWASHDIRGVVPDAAAVGIGPEKKRSCVERDAPPDPKSRVPDPVWVDLSPYLTLRLLLGALMDTRRVNFVNADLRHHEP